MNMKEYTAAILTEEAICKEFNMNLSIKEGMDYQLHSLIF